MPLRQQLNTGARAGASTRDEQEDNAALFLFFLDPLREKINAKKLTSGEIKGLAFQEGRTEKLGCCSLLARSYPVTLRLRGKHDRYRRATSRCANIETDVCLSPQDEGEDDERFVDISCECFVYPRQVCLYTFVTVHSAAYRV